MNAWLVTVRETIVRETEYKVFAESKLDAERDYQKGTDLGNDEEVHSCEILSAEPMKEVK